jgi:L-methionine (R)-S-oxide reductase
MAEELEIASGVDKVSKYETLLPQLRALTNGEPNLIANLANISAAIHHTFNHLWTGFYLVDGNELVLAPFQGPIACTRIPKGKGVCGTSWAQLKSLVVGNVRDFPGHIACSSLSNSEIVVPIFKNKELLALLDIDSENLNQFDEVDVKYLEQISELF